MQVARLSALLCVGLLCTDKKFPGQSLLSDFQGCIIAETIKKNRPCISFLNATERKLLVQVNKLIKLS